MLIIFLIICHTLNLNLFLEEGEEFHILQDSRFIVLSGPCNNASASCKENNRNLHHASLEEYNNLSNNDYLFTGKYLNYGAWSWIKSIAFESYSVNILNSKEDVTINGHYGDALAVKSNNYYGIQCDKNVVSYICRK